MTRDVFLSTASRARELIVSPTVGVRWDEASALERMTVGAVAAHLARAVITVRDYCAAPLPDPVPAPIDAAEYFALATPRSADLDDELNQGIRARADDTAAGGHDAVVRALDDGIVSVTRTLRDAAPDALVAVFGGLVMRVDDYLVTRLVELLVHLDDLAVSIGVDTPAVDPSAVDLVTACFVGIARIRHGDAAVIRAFARRERATAPVFPVF